MRLYHKAEGLHRVPGSPDAGSYHSLAGCRTAWKHHAANTGTWAGGRVRQPWLRRGASPRLDVRHSRAWSTWRAGQRGLWRRSLARHPTSTCSQLESLSQTGVWLCQRAEGPLVRVPSRATHLHLRAGRPRDASLCNAQGPARQRRAEDTVQGPGRHRHLHLHSARQVACSARGVWQLAPSCAFCSMPLAALPTARSAQTVVQCTAFRM